MSVCKSYGFKLSSTNLPKNVSLDLVSGMRKQSTFKKWVEKTYVSLRLTESSFAIDLAVLQSKRSRNLFFFRTFFTDK